MRRFLALGVGWLVAALVAAVVAWRGVGLIGDQVTDDRPPTYTAAEVDAALADTTTTDAPDTTAPPTTAPATTPAADSPAAAPETRRYWLSGGSAALQFSPSGVTVDWAIPNPGYEVRSGPHDGNGWRVEFEGAGGRSRIDAWWDGGPQDDVEDDAGRSSHDDDSSSGDD